GLGHCAEHRPPILDEDAVLDVLHPVTHQQLGHLLAEARRHLVEAQLGGVLVALLLRLHVRLVDAPETGLGEGVELLWRPRPGDVDDRFGTGGARPLRLRGRGRRTGRGLRRLRRRNLRSGVPPPPGLEALAAVGPILHLQERPAPHPLVDGDLFLEALDPESQRRVAHRGLPEGKHPPPELVVLLSRRPLVHPEEELLVTRPQDVDLRLQQLHLLGQRLGVGEDGGLRLSALLLGLGWVGSGHPRSGFQGSAEPRKSAPRGWQTHVQAQAGWAWASAGRGCTCRAPHTYSATPAANIPSEMNWLMERFHQASGGIAEASASAPIRWRNPSSLPRSMSPRNTSTTERMTA